MANDQFLAFSILPLLSFASLSVILSQSPLSPPLVFLVRRTSEFELVPAFRRSWLLGCRDHQCEEFRSRRSCSLAQSAKDSQCQQSYELPVLLPQLKIVE